MTARIVGRPASHCAGARKLACVPPQASKRMGVRQPAGETGCFSEHAGKIFRPLEKNTTFRGVQTPCKSISRFRSEKVIDRRFARQVNFLFRFRVSGWGVFGRNRRVPFLKFGGVSRVVH